MNTHSKKIVRKISIFAALCVAAAIIFSISPYFINLYLKKNHDQFTNIFSTAAKQQITIGSVAIGHRGLEPVLEFRDIVLFNETKTTPLLKITELQLGIDLLGSLINWHFEPGLLSVKGANLLLTQSQDGKVTLSGLKTDFAAGDFSASEFGNMAGWLFNQGKVRLDKINIIWHKADGSELHFMNIHARLNSHLEQHLLQISSSLQQKDSTAQFTANLKLQGDILKHSLSALTGKIEVKDFVLDFSGKDHLPILTFLPDLADLTFVGHNLRLVYDLFRAPIPVDRVSGDLVWNNSETGFNVEIKRAKATNKDFTISSSAILLFPSTDPNNTDQGPVVDIEAKFIGKNIPNLKLYYPVKIMPTRLVTWLDQGIVTGKEISGTLKLRGPLAKFPFDHQEGQFLANAEVRDFTLNYKQGWPNFTGLNAKLIFSNRSMLILADAAKVLGAPTLPLNVKIADLDSAILEAAGSIEEDAKDGLRFIFASPLKNIIGRNLRNVNITGPILVNLQLSVPLGEAVEKTNPLKVSGNVALEGNKIQLAGWGVGLSKVNGELKFTEQGITGENIAAYVFGQPTLLKFDTLNGTSSDPITQVSFSGVAKVSDIQNALNIGLSPYAKGASNYALLLRFHRQPSIDNEIIIDSDLKGITLDFPAGFGKTADDLRPSKLTYYFGDTESQRIYFDYNKQVAAALTFKKSVAPDEMQLTSGELKFGTNNATFQQSPGLIISGTLTQLNWDTWKQFFVEHFRASTTTFSNILRQINLKVDQLELFGQELTKVGLELRADKNNWLVGIDSANIAGRLIIPKNFPYSEVQGNFSRFYITAEKSKFTSIKPKDVPPLNIVVNDFRYDGNNFGRLEFTAVTQGDNLRIDKLLVMAPNFNLTAAGRWYEEGGKQQSSLRGRINCQNIGALLRQWDVTNNLIGGKGVAAFSLDWPNAIFAPTLRTISGIFSISAGYGRIINLSQSTEAGLGFGRVLNMLSLQELPRRLALDFSDIAKTGFSFDTLRGDFSLRSGNAYTQNTRLEGSVAHIKVSGRIGFGARDYDIKLITEPQVASSIPVIAAIAASPIIGAISFVASKVVNAVVSKATSYVYYVTGPWDNPNIIKK